MEQTNHVLKFRILMCMLENDAGKCTVSNIGRILQEEKYTVSRAMIKMEQEGLIDRTDVYSPTLTVEGKNAAERYRERVDIAMNHLLYEGVKVENAKKDACVWAMYCSDELMDVLRASDERYRVKRVLKNEKWLDGRTLCEHMRDGTYFFPFIFYRDCVKENDNISMANKGFRHPCTLHVENGKGVVQLRIVPMSEKSVKNGIPMNGKVSKFEYFDDGQFLSAEFHGDVISFPASALKFMNMGDGVVQIMHGSVCVKMQCSVGVAHMPESTALFTILI